MSKSSVKLFNSWTIVFLFLFSVFPVSPQHNDEIKSQAKQFVGSNDARLHNNPTLYERFSLLSDLAPAALRAGDVKKAEKYARELQAVGDEIRNKSNIHNRMPSYATHVSNIILGLIALDEGKTTRAKEHLLAAGQFTGKPNVALRISGPNMLLAKRLAERGERDAVIQYFDSCSRFWEKENGRLETWKNVVNQGGTPDFGDNELFVVDNWRFRENRGLLHK